MRLLTFVALLEVVALAHAAPSQKPGVMTTVTEKIKGFISTKPPPRPCSAAPRKVDPKSHGFERFEWVVNKRLARSSAPHYQCRDSDQELTAASIQFLKKNKINHVISLNAEARNTAIKDKLWMHGIDYTAVPVEDFHTPTMNDLMKAYKDFTKHETGRSQVWCGYGHGRTGTMITALQMFMAHEKPSPKRFSHADYRKNHVETPGQVQLLDHLQDVLYDMKR